MFGNTLTKRRARLGMQTMTDQAELRLFLRDEHLKQEAEKKRMKRHTTSHGPTPAASQTLPAPPSTAETETVDDDTEDGNAESTRQSTATRLRTIFTSMTSASKEMEAEDVHPAACPPAATKVPLSELFDFSNAYWKKADSRISKRSIDDELELYQMLDLDAEGDIDDFDAADNLSHPDMIL